MDKIKILLVDDHEVVRTGLKTFLQTLGRFEVVAEAASGMEAIQKTLETNPAIVLMDISMPGMDGLEATRQLRKMCPGSEVLALTVHDDKHYFMEMLAAGASGYLTKQAAADELVAALDAIASGNVYLQPALARWLLEDYQWLSSRRGATAAALEEPETEPTSLNVLSARERQVLELVAQGYSNQDIGQRLELSHKTIARHRERIMKKLNLHSRTELVKFAIRTKLITLD
jgi:two-component system, NarL family, response regulator NreC